MQDERGELVPMAEALKIVGCSRSNATRMLRLRLDEATGLSLGGRLEGRLFGRSWFVYRHTAMALGREGSWRFGRPPGSKKPRRSPRDRRAS